MTYAKWLLGFEAKALRSSSVALEKNKFKMIQKQVDDDIRGDDDLPILLY